MEPVQNVRPPSDVRGERDAGIATPARNVLHREPGRSPRLGGGLPVGKEGGRRGLRPVKRNVEGFRSTRVGRSQRYHETSHTEDETAIATGARVRLPGWRIRHHDDQRQDAPPGCTSGSDPATPAGAWVTEIDRKDRSRFLRGESPPGRGRRGKP